jgi:molybdopterin-binding protein
MPLSARNQWAGLVVSVKEGAVMGEVVIKLDNGPEVTSVITMTSVQNLEIKTGSRVMVIIKATEVMLSTDT